MRLLLSIAVIIPLLADIFREPQTEIVSVIPSELHFAFAKKKFNVIPPTFQSMGVHEEQCSRR